MTVTIQIYYTDFKSALKKGAHEDCDDDECDVT